MSFNVSDGLCDRTVHPKTCENATPRLSDRTMKYVAWSGVMSSVSSWKEMTVNELGVLRLVLAFNFLVPLPIFTRTACYPLVRIKVIMITIMIIIIIVDLSRHSVGICNITMCLRLCLSIAETNVVFLKLSV